METFICAWCGKKIKLTTSPEEMEADYLKDFPNDTTEDRDIVCGDCWEIVKPGGDDDE